MTPMPGRGGILIRRSLLAIYAMFLLAPLLGVGLDALGALVKDLLNGGSVSRPLYQEMALLWSPRKAGLLGNSLALATGVSVIGTLLATLAALRLWAWRRHPPALTWFLLAAAVLPPYLHMLTWRLLADQLNLGLSTLGLVELPFGGWFASAWVQIASFTPAAALICLAGLEQLDANPLEAARLVRGDSAALYRIALPLAAPFLRAAGGMLFLFSLLDYSVPYLFGRSVYALDIFADFSMHAHPGRALLNALPLIVAAAGALGFMLGGLRTLFQASTARRHAWRNPPNWPWALESATNLSLLVLGAVALAPPLIMVTTNLIHSGSLLHALQNLGSAVPETSYTFLIGLSAGLICLPLAQAAAQKLAQPGRESWGLWLVTLLPLGLPPALVGIGEAALWSRLALPGVYGADGIVLLTCLARFLPLAALALTAQARRSDPALVDAARLFQHHEWQGWLAVRLPLLAPGLVAAAGLVMALSAGELAALLVVIPPGRSTLTLRLYNFIHYGAPESVAGSGLLLAGLALFGAALLTRMRGADQTASHMQ